MNPKTSKARTYPSEGKHLVALRGYPRSGKDTLGAALVERHGFTRFAFADEVYRQIAASFGVKETELRSNEWKTTPQGLLSIQCSNCPKYRALLEARGEDMKEPRTSRYHLQRYAHDYRRSTDPFYWIGELHQHMGPCEGDIVITDLRYEDDEMVYLKNFAATTRRKFSYIEVIRPASRYVPDNHPSNRAFKTHPDFITVNNEGSPGWMAHETFRFLGLE
jgi:hypothetical protein